MILTLIFLILKLTGVIIWDWIFIFMPVLIIYVLPILLIELYLIIITIKALICG